MKVVGVIPARYKSKRFEGKVLAKFHGKPIIQWVYERASRSRVLSDVIVATDDKRIKDVVEGFSGKVILTSPLHNSGTDRVAEVAKGLSADVIVNIQGDEPLIAPKLIDSIVEPFNDKKIFITTSATKIKDFSELNNRNVVKLVLDKNNFALYFSRSLIPYSKNNSILFAGAQMHKSTRAPVVYKHIGIYAYRLNFLLKFTKMPQTYLEKIEGLEQLRALENGYRIKVVKTNYYSIGVDTPQDLERLKNWMKKRI